MMSLAPLVVVAALVLVPSLGASHLAMDMPGLGGATPPAPTPALLWATALTALAQGAWLRLANPGWRYLGAGFAVAPLGVASAAAGTVDGHGALTARVGAMGAASAELMWALLGVIALAVGYAGARLLADVAARDAERAPRPARLARAGLTLALSLPFVALVLQTSTGLDWTSSWIRWGGCGLAIGLAAAGALIRDQGEDRVLELATLSGVIALSLLAEREYVEALAHAALADRDPFDPEVAWVAGVRELAAAVEPRERFGLVAAALPWISLACGSRLRVALPRALGALAALGATAVIATQIASTLDHRARTAAGAPTAESTDHEPPEVTWSRRVVPRAVPWLRSMRPPASSPPSVRCAAWTPP